MVSFIFFVVSESHVCICCYGLFLAEIFNIFVKLSLTARKINTGASGICAYLQNGDSSHPKKVGRCLTKVGCEGRVVMGEITIP